MEVAPQSSRNGLRYILLCFIKCVTSIIQDVPHTAYNADDAALLHVVGFHLQRVNVTGKSKGKVVPVLN
jgi:hypothetical protein